MQAFPSRLIEKVPRVADIVSFRLERPREYEYRAGQWFVLTFPGPLEPYTHHFSHSNSPLEPELEFTTRLRGTEFKNALNALPVGAEVEVQGPYGSFTLGDDNQRVAFIAGGIGITCVRSILRWLAGSQGSSISAQSREHATPLQIAVIDANRSEANIPFREELAALEAVLPALRVVHVLSQPEVDWPGHRGHIDEGVLAREIAEPHLWSYYVSGPPTFGESMRELLLEWGIHAEAIRLERFEGYE